MIPIAGWGATAGKLGMKSITKTRAIRKVGTVLESVDDVMTNHSLLQGQSYGYIRKMIGNSEGWVNSVMTKTRSVDKGWFLDRLIVEDKKQVN